MWLRDVVRASSAFTVSGISLSHPRLASNRQVAPVCCYGPSEPSPRCANLEKELTMKSVMTYVAVTAISLVLSSGAVAASRVAPSGATQQGHTAQPTMLGPSHATGQPNQSCGSASAPNTPGNAASAPGSAFNPSGHAGTVYAGQQPQNSRNSASVSQYDVACSHQR